MVVKEEMEAVSLQIILKFFFFLIYKIFFFKLEDKEVEEYIFKN